jgi:hypothetical protein
VSLRLLVVVSLAVAFAAAHGATAPAGSALGAGAKRPTVHVIDFEIRSSFDKKLRHVPKGSTYGNCPGTSKVTRLQVKYRASGMTSRMVVTTTWTRNGATIYRDTARWGTPANGVWAYYISGDVVARNGAYVVRFVYRGRLIGRGSVTIACGGFVDPAPTP